ncbi:MAG: rhodanese-like domain-containing protein [Alphaproteobacteria bacterium]|nr:rhodanese-like domain-containing protein [Alphaproteobacteria bacterium]
MKKLFALSLLFLAACSPAAKEISPRDLKKDALILDVRTPEEYQTISLGRKHWFVPLNKLDAAKFIQEYKLDSSTPLYILCRTGKKAAVAAKEFEKVGFKNVAVIQGGIVAAEKAGLPVKNGR